MEKLDIYQDIASRTNGDIFVGVVGPVRTGKSTFISKFMENFVLPNITNKLQKQVATDEMPQSASGKVVMTTEPKFVPANSVKVMFKNKSTANVRLIDCVGYMVNGASIGEDEDKRMVKTPWDDNPIPFSIAAEIGTKKVITDYSTIGIVVTTDGSFTDIARENYEAVEERTVLELKALNKPFIIVLNSSNPNSEQTLKLASSMQEKYGVAVVPVSVNYMTQDDISAIMEKVLLEFPMQSFNVCVPNWVRSLPASSSIITEITNSIKQASNGIVKMNDYSAMFNAFSDSENLNNVEISELKLGEGIAEYSISVKDGVYYKVLSEECGEEIKDDSELLSYITNFADCKKKFTKIKDALNSAEDCGYGIVLPSLEEMQLEEPTLVKQGSKYGVKLKAKAPSLHIMKVDVSTELSPIVGNQKQGEDLVNYITDKYENNPSGIWETDMFGKSLHELVSEGITGKISQMPKDAQTKMRKTVTRIVNENRGGVICILL